MNAVRCEVTGRGGALCGVGRDLGGMGATAARLAVDRGGDGARCSETAAARAACARLPGAGRKKKLARWARPDWAARRKEKGGAAC